MRRKIKQTLETVVFTGYTALALWVGWSAHEQLSPMLNALNQVRSVQSTFTLPGAVNR